MTKRNWALRLQLMLVAGLLGLAQTGLVKAAHRPVAHVIDITDIVKRTFPAQRGGQLEIDADQGNVEIVSGKSSEVRIAVERIVSVNTKEEAKAVLESHNLVIDRKGSTIWVHSRVEKDRFAWKRSGERLRIKIIVEVPDEYDLEIASGAGNVSVGDVKGWASVRTGAGNVTIGDTDGDLEIFSGSGNIEIRTTKGDVRVRNGAGNVLLDNVQGRINADLGAGNITARFLSTLDAASELSTSAGQINVQVADNIGANVSAIAKVGSCSTDFPLKVSGSWMKKSFDGSINGGGPNLTLRTNVGNIVLTRLE